MKTHTPKFLERWNQLSASDQKWLTERIMAQPVILRRPLLKRLPLVPRIFWRHWQIGRGYMTEWNAFRFAFSWTRIFVFGT